MYGMFAETSSFNVDISKWDVSRVTNMDSMFWKATSFKRHLCGATWVHSQASKRLMFAYSPGSMARSACTETREDPREPKGVWKYVSRLVRAPTSTTPFSTITLAITTTNKITCPKCGTFEKSGRVSCCAPGGAWYKHCGGADNKNVDHRWSDGAAACKRKFNAM